MATNPSLSPIPPSKFYMSTQTPKEPQKESMPPQSTPIKRSAASHGVYTTNHIYNDPVFVRAAGEMQGKYEEILPRDFLDMLEGTDAKMPTINYKPFKAVAKLQNERAMYDPFIVAMKSYLKAGWTLVNTSNHVDPSTARIFGDREIKPDMGLYSSSRDGKPITQASEAELFGEFKFAIEDEPFRVKAQKKNRSMPLEAEPLTARETRGQITLYINAIQAMQQRTRVFSFYIRGRHCRLFCHSRAGTKITPLFNYTRVPYLHKFFWLLSHASSDGRGYDTSLEPVDAKSEDPEAKIARVKLGISSTDPLYKVYVKDRLFYISQPFTSTHLYPVGRGTRCFSAYDPVLEGIVLLKDTWRITDYKAEDEIYDELHKNRVRHIPRVVIAGRVMGKFQNAIMGGRKHEHYRIVLDVVGKPLYAAKSSHQFMFALLCAFRAHWDAWKLAGILHRDISIGNIIIVQGEGMLIDWERAKSKDNTEVRALERTGTWQFMSVRILKNPGTVHEVHDDIESFIHVALWTSARYIRNNMTPDQRSVFLSTFDFQTDDPAVAKKRMLGLGTNLLNELMLTTQWFRDAMQELLRSISYLHNDQLVEMLGDLHGANEAEDRSRRMLTHDWMETTLDALLLEESWKAFADPLENLKLKPLSNINLKRKKDNLDECRAAVKKQRVNEDDLDDSDGESDQSDSDSESEYVVI